MYTNVNAVIRTERFNKKGLIFRGHQLDKINAYEYIEVMFTNDWNFDLEITSITKFPKCTTHCINQCLKKNYKEIKIQLYNTISFSTLSMPLNHSKKHKKMQQQQQK